MLILTTLVYNNRKGNKEKKEIGSTTSQNSEEHTQLWDKRLLRADWLLTRPLDIFVSGAVEILTTLL